MPSWLLGLIVILYELRSKKNRAMAMLIIDRHTHVYSLDEKQYPPAKALLTLGWTGRPMETALRPPEKAPVEALREEAQANGVRAACIVQTRTFYRFDNRYI